MEKSLMDIEKEIGAIGESCKSAHKRIDNLEPVVRTIYELATSVKVMAEKMNNMDGAINQMKTDMDEYHHKEPNKLWFNVKNAIITGIVAIIVSTIMGLILK